MNESRPILLAVGVVLAVFGILCAAKPDKMADYARRRHLRSSRFIQKWPFAGMVMESWIPTYIRFMGLFVVAVGVMLILIGVFVEIQT
jgi:uncharacterized membrane protein